MEDLKEQLKEEIPKVIWEILNHWVQKELLKTQRGQYTQETNRRIEDIVSRIHNHAGRKAGRREIPRHENVTKYLGQDIENVIWDSLRKWGEKEILIQRVKEISDDIQLRLNDLFEEIDLEAVVYDRRTGDRRAKARRQD